MAWSLTHKRKQSRHTRRRRKQKKRRRYRRTVAARSRNIRKKRATRRRRRRRGRRKINFSWNTRGLRAAKHKTPTSFSVFPDKSPQLQKKGEFTKLNKYTTKNVAVQEGVKIYNAIINERLAYQRPARGQLHQQFPKIIYGPKVARLTKNNYKKLKKGMKLYYDRGSVILRGPFIFEKVNRGPLLIFSIKDAAYNTIYHFSLQISQLEKEKMYFIIKK